MQNVQLRASFVTKLFFANTMVTIHGILIPSAPNLQVSKHMPYPTVILSYHIFGLRPPLFIPRPANPIRKGKEFPP